MDPMIRTILFVLGSSGIGTLLSCAPSGPRSIVPWSACESALLSSGCSSSCTGEGGSTLSPSSVRAIYASVTQLQKRKRFYQA